MVLSTLCSICRRSYCYKPNLLLLVSTVLRCVLFTLVRHTDIEEQWLVGAKGITKASLDKPLKTKLIYILLVEAECDQTYRSES